MCLQWVILSCVVTCTLAQPQCTSWHQVMKSEQTHNSVLTSFSFLKHTGCAQFHCLRSSEDIPLTFFPLVYVIYRHVCFKPKRVFERLFWTEQLHVTWKCSDTYWKCMFSNSLYELSCSLDEPAWKSFYINSSMYNFAYYVHRSDCDNMAGYIILKKDGTFSKCLDTHCCNHWSELHSGDKSYKLN